MSRTILTSFTAWLVVVILYLFGGEGLHGFAFALVVGFLSGTYSTVYIATPILIDFVATKPEPPPRPASNWRRVDAAEATGRPRADAPPHRRTCPPMRRCRAPPSSRHRAPSSSMPQPRPATIREPRSTLTHVIAQQVESIPSPGQLGIASDQPAEHRAEVIEDRRQQPRQGLRVDRRLAIADRLVAMLPDVGGHAASGPSSTLIADADQDATPVRRLDSFGQDAAQFAAVDLHVVGPADAQRGRVEAQLDEGLDHRDGRGQRELRLRLAPPAHARRDRWPG